MMKRESPPAWSLILWLYAIAAIFLIIVRDEIGTDNDLQLKSGVWIPLIFVAYWSFRGVLAWVGTSAAPVPDIRPPSQPGGRRSPPYRI
jgi:hypothetical protein